MCLLSAPFWKNKKTPRKRLLALLLWFWTSLSSVSRSFPPDITCVLPLQNCKAFRQLKLLAWSKNDKTQFRHIPPVTCQEVTQTVAAYLHLCFLGNYYEIIEIPCHCTNWVHISVWLVASLTSNSPMSFMQQTTLEWIWLFVVPFSGQTANCVFDFHVPVVWALRRLYFQA